MATVLLYVFPMLFAFVFIPKQIESTTPLETEGEKSDIATKRADVNNVGKGQKSRSDSDNIRHGHNRHRHTELEEENAEPENSNTMEESTTSFPEAIRNDQKTKIDDGSENMDGNDGTLNAYQDVTNDNNEYQDSITDNEDKEIKDNDDATSVHDDAIYEHVAETDTNRAVIQPENDGESESTTKSSEQESSTHCPTCSKAIVEKEVKIEMVKQHLLQKLGLSSAPEVDDPLPPLPFDFYVGEDFSMNDDNKKEKEETINNVKTREMFIFGKDITDKCAKKKSTGCYSFNITTSIIEADLVSSVELWIYKQPDVNDHHIQEFMVSELEPYTKGGKEVLRFRNIVKRIETRLKYGWMKIYVRRSVIRWLSKPHRNHGLAVVCKTCQRQNHKTIYGTKEGYTPILVFYMKKHTHSHRRYRRHAPCVEGGMNCCHKEELEINFRDIGWNYIMTPEVIRPNFCTGSCNGIRAAYYNHTRLMQTLRQSVLHDFSSIQTCCSPVSFARPQSLLYRDNFGVVRKVDVPDLIVGECGCT